MNTKDGYSKQTLDNTKVLLAGGGDINLKTNGSGTSWPYITSVRGDGVMEIGRYLDFHHESNDGIDYAIRLQINNSDAKTDSSKRYGITLPNKSGTIALTSDISSYAIGLTNTIANDKLPLRLQEFITSNDLDTSTYNGFGRVSSNSPFKYLHTNAEDCMTINTAYSSSWTGQLATDYRTNNIAYRAKNNGTWTEWAEMLSTKNTGLIFNPEVNIQCDPRYSKFTKCAGGDNWNTEIKSTVGYRECRVVFQPEQTDKHLMVGLNSDQNENASYNTIDYAWYVRNDGGLNMYENGTSINSISGHTSYSAGDEFIVEYSDGCVKYYHNGVLCRRVNRTYGTKLYLDSSFYSTSGSIYGLKFEEVHSPFNINRPANAVNWYSIQQYNSSDANPSYFDPNCATINYTHYNGWNPWIRCAGNDYGSWALGNYTTNVHLIHFDKSNTGNSQGNQSWNFMSDGTFLMQYNNQWLTTALLQLGRTEETVTSNRAVIGVTNGNLHLDAYQNKGLYLNYYCSGGNVYFNGGSYYINGGYYNGTSANATKATQDSDGNSINTTYLKLTGGTLTGNLVANGVVTSLGDQGYITSTTASLSSYWCKIWDATITQSQYNNLGITFLFQSQYNVLFGIICMNIRQNGGNGSTSYNFSAGLYKIAGNIPTSVLRLYYNNSTGYCELWGNVREQYGVFNVSILKRCWRVAVDDSSSIGTLYRTNFTSAQTLPSTTQVDCQDISTANSSNYINLVATNEIQFRNKPSSLQDIWFNWRWADQTFDDKINRYIFGNGNKGYAGITAEDLLINTGDATLKIYSGRITDSYTDGFICMQTSIDGTDGESHTYPTQYGKRCAIALQPRGGTVYVGTTVTAANTYADTTNKLVVGGSINVTSGGITIGGNTVIHSGNISSYADTSTKWVGTQSQYDAITNKDSNTFYFIIES